VSNFIKKGLDISDVDFGDESASTEGESSTGADSKPSSAERAEQADAADKQAEIDSKLMTAALKAVDKGIDKGISKDFSSTKGIEGSIIGGIFKGLSLMMGQTGGLLERQVKTESTMEFDNTKVNENSKRAFQKYIISPSINLYDDNFDAFMKLVQNTNISKNITNDTSETQALAIEFKSMDESARTTGSNSPHKLILNQLIPLIRAKFDAIVSFKEKVGAGSNIDYEGVGGRFSIADMKKSDMKKKAQEKQINIGSEGVQDLSGSEEGGSTEDLSDDAAQLGGLYRAIDDWHQLIVGLSRGGSMESVRKPASGSKKPGGTDSDKDKPEEGGDAKLPSFEEVVKGIRIQSVRPGGGAQAGANPGEIVIDRRLVSDPTNIPVVSLILDGPMAKYVKPVGKDMDYFLYFMRSGKIKTLKDTSTDLPKFITSVSSENISDGAKLTLLFNPSAILQETAKASDMVKLMEVRAIEGDIAIMANDDTILDDLIKLSSASSVTPLYETVSPGGERVVFTPADLVMGGGKLKDSKGNKFKIRNRKGKSLSDRVMSPNFGKVKRGLK